MSQKMDLNANWLSMVKPCKVVIEKLSTEDINKYKILGGHELDKITDKKLLSPSPASSITTTDDEDDSDNLLFENKIIEIEIPDLSTKNKQESDDEIITANSNGSSDNDKLTKIKKKNNIDDKDKDEPKDALDVKKISGKFSCIFCKMFFDKFEDAYSHYQYHIEYYPYKCMNCQEVMINQEKFIEHIANKHPELVKTKVKFIKRQNSKIELWISLFLSDQSKSIYNQYPQMYCPACDWVEKVESELNKKRTPLVILSHIHRHLKYFPYECIPCKNLNKDICFNIIDNKARAHLIDYHPELMDKDRITYSVFPRRYTIPKLDEFIDRYLNACGIKKPFLKPFIKKMTPREQFKLSYKSVNNKYNPVTPTSMTNEGKSKKSAQIKTSSSVDPNKTCHKTESKAGPSDPTKKTLTPTLNNTPVGANKNLLIEPVKPIEYNVVMPNNVLVPGKVYQISSLNNLKQNFASQINLEANLAELMRLNVEEEQKKFFCVFCEQETEFDCRLKAYDHYAGHVGYKPVVCLLCHDNFHNLDDLKQHNNESHQQLEGNLLYYLKENDIIENWIEDFLTFQNQPEIEALISYSDGCNCPVCKKLAKDDDDVLVIYKNNDYVQTLDHIRRHFNYFPYVCTICQYNNITARFSSINQSSLNHLKNIHHYVEINLLNHIHEKIIVNLNRVDYLEKYIHKIVAPLYNDEPKVNKIIEDILKTADEQSNLQNVDFESAEILKRKITKLFPSLFSDKNAKKMKVNHNNNNCNNKNVNVKPICDNQKQDDIKCLPPVISIDDSYGDGLVQANNNSEQNKQIISLNQSENKYPLVTYSALNQIKPMNQSTANSYPLVSFMLKEQESQKITSLMKCMYCSLYFKNHRDLLNHLSMKHRNNSIGAIMSPLPIQLRPSNINFSKAL